MTRNQKLAYYRRRRAELEGFREPTKGIIAAHREIVEKIVQLISEGPEGESGDE